MDDLKAPNLDEPPLVCKQRAPLLVFSGPCTLAPPQNLRPHAIGADPYTAGWELWLDTQGEGPKTLPSLRDGGSPQAQL